MSSLDYLKKYVDTNIDKHWHAQKKSKNNGDRQ